MSFVPLSFAEFAYLYSLESQSASEAFGELLRDPLGKEIGFSFGVPDRINNTFIIKTIGVLPEYRYSSGGVLLGESQVRHAQRSGFNSVIYALRKNKKIPRKVN